MLRHVVHASFEIALMMYQSRLKDFTSHNEAQNASFANVFFLKVKIIVQPNKQYRTTSLNFTSNYRLA